jgi:uncharacterized protein YjbI with pentapeptide repeats
MSGTTGLHAAQLAGADLTGAKLPTSVADLLKDLTGTKGITDNAQKLFVAMLAASLYSWLTIATTTDLNLITNRASSPLPIIQTSIPIVGFYVVAPLLLAGVYFYFHLYLQKLWDELGSLPAIFPDGRPLQAKADPWILSDLVQSHVSKLSAGRPFLSLLQKWISILLAWWVVPITLLLFWARYLPRHDWAGTIFHSVLAAVCITAAIFLYRLASATLGGKERKPFRWKSAVVSVGAYRTAAVALGVTTVLIVASAGTLNGIRCGSSDLDWWPKATGPASWLPRIMTAAGYSPFADLRTAEISLKPATWTGSGSDAEYNAVKGLQLGAADLRFADLRNAFLPWTVLTGAHLEWTDLLLADLRHSELAGAHLYKADLLGAHLNDADMVGTDLREAELTGADLTTADVKYADFSKATGLTEDQLKNAKNWKDAVYDANLLPMLGLPGDNNDRVKKQRVADEDAMRRDPVAAETARVSQLSHSVPGLATQANTFIAAYLIRRSAVGPSGDGNPANPNSAEPPTGAASVGTTPLESSFSVAEVARLYNVPRGVDGRGQMIGIIELSGGYRDSDLDKYFAEYKLPRPKVSAVSVDGAGNKPTGNRSGADSQVELDIEVAGAVAPGSQIMVYFSPNTVEGYTRAVNRALSDDTKHPSVILINWGGPESSWGETQLMAMNEALRRAADMGITVVVPSGNGGASDGVLDHHTHVDFPASSPWVLAVGGTKLVASGNTISSEVCWNDGQTGGASGGGESDVFGRPNWQATSLLRADGKPGRALPDVAANASPSTGYRVYVDGINVVIGGTSAAAPLWAGLIALLNQSLGRNLGYINPVLYQKLGPSGVFRDVQSGNNSLGVKGYAAGPGWDACTGWGSPDGQKLLQALRALR